MDSEMKDQQLDRSLWSSIKFLSEDAIPKLENGDDADLLVYGKVDSNILMHKIKTIDITGKIVKWLEIFLKKTQQRFKVNSHLSD